MRPGAGFGGFGEIFSDPYPRGALSWCGKVVPRVRIHHEKCTASSNSLLPAKESSWFLSLVHFLTKPADFGRNWAILRECARRRIAFSVACRGTTPFFSAPELAGALCGRVLSAGPGVEISAPFGVGRAAIQCGSNGKAIAGTTPPSSGFPSFFHSPIGPSWPSRFVPAQPHSCGDGDVSGMSCSRKNDGRAFRLSLQAQQWHC